VRMCGDPEAVWKSSNLVTPRNVSRTMRRLHIRRRLRGTARPNSSGPRSCSLHKVSLVGCDRTHFGTIEFPNVGTHDPSASLGTEQKGPRMTTTTTVPGTPKLDVGVVENASAFVACGRPRSRRDRRRPGHRAHRARTEHQTPLGHRHGASTRAPSKAQPASGKCGSGWGGIVCRRFHQYDTFPALGQLREGGWWRRRPSTRATQTACGDVDIHDGAGKLPRSR